MAGYDVKINVDAQAANKSLDTFSKSTERAIKRVNDFSEALIDNGADTKEVIKWAEKHTESLKNFTSQLRQANKDSQQHARDIKTQAKASADYSKTIEKLSAQYSPYLNKMQKLSKLRSDLTMLEKEGIITGRALTTTYIKSVNAINTLTSSEQKSIASKQAQIKNVEALRKSYDPLYAAQRRYQKSTQDLMTLLSAGGIGLKEFNAQMDQQKIILDKVGTAQERNANATAKQNTVLNNLKLKYDSVYAANIKFNKSTSELNMLFDKGRISADQYNRSFRNQEQILKEAINGKTQLHDTQVREFKDLENLRKKYDYIGIAQRNYATNIANIDRLLKAGIIDKERSLLYLEKEKVLLESVVLSKQKLSNTALAEKKSLDSLRATYDSNFAANMKFNQAVSELNMLMQKTNIGIDTYNKAFKEQERILKESLTTKRALNEAHVKEFQSLNALRLSLDGIYAAEQRYKTATEGLLKLKDKAWISEERYNTLMLEQKRVLESVTLTKGKLSTATLAEKTSLDQLKATYDSSFAASQRFNMATADLNILLSKGRISIDFYNKAMQEQERVLKKSLATKQKLQDSHVKEFNSLNNLRAKYDTVYAATIRFNRAKAELIKLNERGVITTAKYNTLLQQQINKLRDATGQTDKNIGSVKRLGIAIKEVGFTTAALNGYLHALKFAWKAFFTLTVVKTLGSWAIGFAKAGEGVDLLGKKLEYLTKRSDALGLVSDSVHRVGIDFQTMNKTLTRFAITTKNAFSIEEMIGWTEALVKSGRAVGSTNQELQAGLLQLSQAMSAGRLMGDEFRSISENLPLLKIELQKIFEEMGMGDVALKQLSRDGKITSDILVKAFQNLGATVKGFPGAIDTIDAAIARVRGQANLFIREITTGDALKGWINALANGLKRVREYFFGPIEGAKELSAETESIASVMNMASTSIDKVSKSTNSIAEGFSIAAQSILGIKSAVAGTNEEMSGFNSTLVTLGQAFAIIFGVVIFKNISKFAFAITGLKSTFKALGAGLGFFANMLGKTTIGMTLFARLLPAMSAIGGVVAALGTPIIATTAAIIGGSIAISAWVSSTIEAREAQNELNSTMLESETKLKAFDDTLKGVSESLGKTVSIEQAGTLVDTYTLLLQDAVVEVANLEKEKAELAKTFSDANTNYAEASEKIRILNDRLRNGRAAIVTFTGMLKVANNTLEITKDKAEDAEYAMKQFAMSMNIPKEIKGDYKTFLDNEKKAIVLADKARAAHVDEKKVLADLLLMRQRNAQQFARAQEASASSSAKKDFNKLIQAEKELAKVRAAGIGGRQLEDAVKNVEKYNGVLDARLKKEKELKEFQKDEKQRLKDLAKSQKEAMNLFKEYKPAMASYIEEVDKLTKAREAGVLTEEEYNKKLEFRKTLLASGKTEEEANKAMERKIKLWQKFNPELSTYVNESKELAEALKAGIITEEEFNKKLEEQYQLLRLNSGAMSDAEKAIAGWNNGLKTFVEESKDYYSQMDEFSQKTMNSMTDALTEFVTTGKMDFKGLVDSIVADLTRLAIKNAIIAPLAEMLQIDGSKSSSPTGGIAGVAASMFGGSSEEQTSSFSVNNSDTGIMSVLPALGLGGDSGACNPCDIAGETVGTSFASMFESVDEGFDTTFENMDEGFGSIVDDVGTGFDSVINDIGGGFSSVISSLGSLFSGDGGGFGDMFSGAADFITGLFANGGAFNNGVQAFANGGVIGSPTLFPMADGAGLMGESGPEAIMPLTRKNGKLGVEASGGSSTTINININVAGVDGNSETMRRSAGQVAQAAGNATQRAMRRNG